MWREEKKAMRGHVAKEAGGGMLGIIVKMNVRRFCMSSQPQCCVALSVPFLFDFGVDVAMALAMSMANSNIPIVQRRLPVMVSVSMLTY